MDSSDCCKTEESDVTPDSPEMMLLLGVGAILEVTVTTVPSEAVTRGIWVCPGEMGVPLAVDVQ